MVAIQSYRYNISTRTRSHRGMSAATTDTTTMDSFIHVSRYDTQYSSCTPTRVNTCRKPIDGDLKTMQEFYDMNSLSILKMRMQPLKFSQFKIPRQFIKHNIPHIIRNDI